MNRQGVHTWLRLLLAGCSSLAVSATALGGEVRVAVAANFNSPMKVLMPLFERETGHTWLLSSGATSKLYAQIKSGAPFDVFLSADVETPARLESENAALRGTRFTYARGRLVLWSAQADFVDAQGAVLLGGKFKHLGLAAPKLAPYGAAAVQTLTQLGQMDRLQGRFVQGESIAQAYSFVASGNAELGFVALSQVYESGKIKGGSGWIVPAHLHTPLRQDAVQLERGRGNAAALAFLDFLKSEKARTVIRSFGYETE